MTIIANLLLFIASACIYGLNTGALARPAPGGDAAVGYAWSLILLNLVFCVAMIFVSIITGSKGGYSWVPGSGGSRTFLLISGILSALIVSCVGSMFKNEPGVAPGIVKTVVTVMPWIIPSLLVMGHFLLLNNKITGNFSPNIYRLPLVITGVISIILCIFLIIGFIVQSAADSKAMMATKVKYEDENQQRMLADIDSCNISTDMVFILVMTDSNHDSAVRDRAVAKVKTHPDYQGELIRILGTGYVAEAFHFLASNEVDDPKRFPEAIKKGILMQAQAFRETIRRSSHPSHFYPELFIWETERALRTVDRYKGMGVDLKPAVKELRNSLNEPTGFDKPEFKCAALMDKWLEKN